MLYRAAFIASVSVTSAIAAGAELAAADYKHLGVASCAASVCHGKLTAQTGRDVALNEYRIWLQNDQHSQAYRVLESARSKSIAANLGWGSASAAKICLDCHADNVPAAMRGPKFQISDGVACEACHGGAEKWIETHTQQAATHADNVARGLYPTEQPLRRAERCLSCHLGTSDKFATHAIMGAGHPRLAFELDTYSANQPAHFHPRDPGYIRRKGKIGEMNLWLTGQLENAERYLALLQSDLSKPAGLMPEFAFYDCFSCHHSIDKPRWSRSRAGAGLQPGSLHLDRKQLLMLRAITEVVDPPRVAELIAATDALMRAGHTDIASVHSAAKTLDDWVRSRADWAQRNYSAVDVASVRKMLLRYAGDDKASDFAMAEQVVLGVESLSYAAGDHDRRKAALDALYNTVKSAANFNPTQFADVARGLQGQF